MSEKHRTAQRRGHRAEWFAIAARMNEQHSMPFLILPGSALKALEIGGCRGSWTARRYPGVSM
ncbi:MAG: hypothetical protein ACR2PF_11285, partial [Rhizobiaceae bacterium]